MIAQPSASPIPITPTFCRSRRFRAIRRFPASRLTRPRQTPLHRVTSQTSNQRSNTNQQQEHIMQTNFRKSIIAAATTLSLALSAFAAAANAGELTVDIKGVTSEKGNIMLAIYSKDDKWMGKPLKGTMTAVKGATASVSFGDLPEGEYAITLFVDENSNGKLDMNAIGIPTEPFAFSNDANGSFGPPSFEKAKFSVGKDAKTVAITIK
jgi:uncharacterized protein (DUF2141 family)